MSKDADYRRENFEKLAKREKSKSQSDISVKNDCLSDRWKMIERCGNITVPDYKPGEKKWPIYSIRYLFTLVKRLIEIDADNDASSVGSKLDGVLELH